LVGSFDLQRVVNNRRAGAHARGPPKARNKERKEFLIQGDPMTQILPSRPTRTLTVALTCVQWRALESMNDIWMMGDDLYALSSSSPARRQAYQPILRAAASPLVSYRAAPEATQMCQLVGEDLLYWNAEGTGVWLPGVPGELPVVYDTGRPPAVRLGEALGRSYYTVSGAIAIHSRASLPVKDAPFPDAFPFVLSIWAGEPDHLEAGWI